MAQAKKTNSINQEKKIWAAASYLWILSLIVLIARKKDDYIRFHANQGALLFVLSLFIWIPLVGWFLGLAVVIMAIIGILKAITGEKWQIPVFGQAAEKLGEWIIKTLKV